jgi:hypothetical protein
MFTHYGERHGKLLDQGINVISVLSPKDVVGVSSSYFGDGSGMLILEQSPHLLDAHSARLRILGAVAGGDMYGDENKLSFRLSNNVNLPDGTHVLLRETIERPIDTVPDRLPDNALEAFGDISRFVRTISGNLHSADLYGSTTSLSGVKAEVSGVIKDDAMYEAYLRTIESGVILGVQENPVSATSVPSTQHDVLTPDLNQVLTVTMFDHRPGNREAMLALRNE